MSKVADQGQGARSTANPVAKAVMGKQRKASEPKANGPIKE
jgi:hypothetical protein